MKKVVLASVLALGALYGASPVSVTASPAAPIAKKTEAATIVTIAAGNKNFSTLVAALRAAGLVETLSGKGPFTVFAPTDAAFKALPPGTVEKLLRPENKQALVRVLTYHVVPGQVLAKDVKPGAVKTVEGNTIRVAVAGGKVKVNNANVTAVDLKGSNGVIHVIDAVILPPGLKL
jgi:uncharacterized surface protein with fasciclin (FAS1) repeats